MKKIILPLAITAITMIPVTSYSITLGGGTEPKPIIKTTSPVITMNDSSGKAPSIMDVMGVMGGSTHEERQPPKYWVCGNICKSSNPTEEYIYFEGSKKLVEWDNKLMEVWSVLEKKHPNNPLTLSRGSWVNGRDTLAKTHFLNKGDKKGADAWLIEQYAIRVKQVWDSHLVK